MENPLEEAVQVKMSQGAVAASSSSNASIEKRVATHSHIRGLGLNEQGIPLEGESSGFIGQSDAREAAGIIVDMVKARKMAGRAVLIAGEPGTGKTALALAMSQELGPKVPFIPLVGSEVYSAEMLMENMRRAIGLRVKEIKEVFEGEVVEIQPHEVEHPLSSQGKTIASVALTLKTAKGSRTLKLDPSIYESILKAKVRSGDIIYIESNSGAVKRLGRCSAYKAEFDLEADEYVPLPKGEVSKKREVIQDVTLHDLDMANARPSGGGSTSDILALVGQMMRPNRTEITDRLRREVNKLVCQYIEAGTAELIPGILFIDEVHMLDLECFAFLNRAVELPIAPIIVLATNRGMATVRGTEGTMQSPHGIPKEMLDRLLIIKTYAYSRSEALTITSLRAKAEGLQFDDDALLRLADIAQECSLRYSLQLLAPSAVMASAQGRSRILSTDVEEAALLFLDTKRSAHIIEENPSNYVTC